MHKNNSSAMKRWLAGLSATFVMAFEWISASVFALTTQKTLSLSDVTFGCYSVNGQAVTVAVPRNQKLGIPIIDWYSESLSFSSREAEKKCRLASNRFEELRQIDSLKYITIGYGYFSSELLGKSRMICTVNYPSDDCTEGYSLSLLPNDFSDQDFLKIFRGLSNEPIVRSFPKPIVTVTKIIGYSTPRVKIDRQIITFSCIIGSEESTTIARTSKGVIPIIFWKSNSFISSSWTREKRCQEVSDRFDELRFNNSLNYITSGVINEQAVICAVKTQTDLCTPESILFTLDKNSDPQKILKQMFLANADIPIDDNGVGKLKDGRDFVCMSRSASGNCSGLLISAIEL